MLLVPKKDAETRLLLIVTRDGTQHSPDPAPSVKLRAVHPAATHGTHGPRGPPWEERSPPRRSCPGWGGRGCRGAVGGR